MANNPAYDALDLYSAYKKGKSDAMNAFSNGYGQSSFENSFGEMHHANPFDTSRIDPYTAGRNSVGYTGYVPSNYNFSNSTEHMFEQNRQTIQQNFQNYINSNQGTIEIGRNANPMMDAYLRGRNDAGGHGSAFTDNFGSPTLDGFNKGQSGFVDMSGFTDVTAKYVTNRIDNQISAAAQQRYNELRPTPDKYVALVSGQNIKDTFSPSSPSYTPTDYINNGYKTDGYGAFGSQKWAIDHLPTNPVVNMFHQGQLDRMSQIDAQNRYGTNGIDPYSNQQAYLQNQYDEERGRQLTSNRNNTPTDSFSSSNQNGPFNGGGFNGGGFNGGGFQGSFNPVNDDYYLTPGYQANSINYGLAATMVGVANALVQAGERPFEKTDAMQAYQKMQHYTNMVGLGTNQFGRAPVRYNAERMYSQIATGVDSSGAFTKVRITDDMQNDLTKKFGEGFRVGTNRTLNVTRDYFSSINAVQQTLQKQGIDISGLSQKNIKDALLNGKLVTKNGQTFDLTGNKDLQQSLAIFGDLKSKKGEMESAGRRGDGKMLNAWEQQFFGETDTFRGYQTYRKAYGTVMQGIRTGKMAGVSAINGAIVGVGDIGKVRYIGSAGDALSRGQGIMNQLGMGSGMGSMGFRSIRVAPDQIIRNQKRRLEEMKKARDLLLKQGGDPAMIRQLSDAIKQAEGALGKAEDIAAGQGKAIGFVTKSLGPRARDKVAFIGKKTGQLTGKAIYVAGANTIGRTAAGKAAAKAIGKMNIPGRFGIAKNALLKFRNRVTNSVGMKVLSAPFSVKAWIDRKLRKLKMYALLIILGVVIFCGFITTVLGVLGKSQASIEDENGNSVLKNAMQQVTEKEAGYVHNLMGYDANSEYAQYGIPKSWELKDLATTDDTKQTINGDDLAVKDTSGNILGYKLDHYWGPSTQNYSSTRMIKLHEWEDPEDPDDRGTWNDYQYSFSIESVAGLQGDIGYYYINKEDDKENVAVDKTSEAYLKLTSENYKNPDVNVTFHYNGSQYSYKFTNVKVSSYTKQDGTGPITYNEGALYNAIAAMATAATQNGDEHGGLYEKYFNVLFDAAMNAGTTKMNTTFTKDTTQSLTFHIMDTAKDSDGDAYYTYHNLDSHGDPQGVTYTIPYSYKANVELDVYLNDVGLQDLFRIDTVDNAWMHNNGSTDMYQNGAVTWDGWQTFDGNGNMTISSAQQSNRDIALAFYELGFEDSFASYEGGLTNGGDNIYDVDVNADDFTIPDNGGNIPVPYLSMANSKWAALPFGGGTIGYTSEKNTGSGCSITSLSMAFDGLQTDKSKWIYPSTIRNQIIQHWGNYNHYYDGKSGQKWTIFGDVASWNGYNCQDLGTNTSLVIQELKAGHPVLMSCSPGDFTKHGHIICLTGIRDDGTIVLNDPGSRAHSTYSYKTWTIQRLAKQAKGFWAISKQ